MVFKLLAALLSELEEDELDDELEDEELLDLELLDFDLRAGVCTCVHACVCLN